ncbi:MAG: threonine--tRNA ligase [Acidimicrobiia bacterium]
MSIQITFPDGTVREYDDGTSGLDVARSIGTRLAASAVAVAWNGQQRDLDRPLEGDGTITIITDTSEEGRSVLRHSAAHVLAQAVLDLFEGAHFAIGPAITDGFYYDFDIGRPFNPADLEQIQARMEEIIATDQPFVRDEVDRSTALDLFADQPFKREIIEGVEESEGAGGVVVSLYRNDGFVDLCRGPHLPSTGKLRAVKLLRAAGAYWRGDENNAQLQRIYGTAWESGEALSEYLHRIEEAERRDHRRLGPELDLFSFPSDLGSGLAIWHPKGALVRKEIEDYSRRVHLANGYDMVFSPHVAKSDLWRTSGHVDFYKETMYPEMELDGGQGYFVKPMNCPFHILVFKGRARSYRELPMRLYELGTVYRYERSGVVHGLLRARGFTQDDSHIFVGEDDLGVELQVLLDFTLDMLRDFGFTTFEADLSTRPEKFVGDPQLWDRATQALQDTLETAAVPYAVAAGEGAFYGPKIDLHIRDAIGRRWQLSTLQVDFAQPENFKLEFATSSNTRVRPVMVHRALLGSIERFFGILLEHYAGSFPGWLAPVQVSVVPVADRHVAYADEVASRLRADGLRVEVDSSDDTVGEKIRRAISVHHPAVLVVGDADVEAGTVGVRMRGDESERRGVPQGEAADQLVDACRRPR